MASNSFDNRLIIKQTDICNASNTTVHYSYINATTKRLFFQSTLQHHPHWIYISTVLSAPTQIVVREHTLHLT